MGAFFANQTSITTFRAFVLGSFVVLGGLIAGLVVGDFVWADIGPPKCSGMTSDNSNPCGEVELCQTSGCTEWFTPLAGGTSLTPGQPWDNWLLSSSSWLICGEGDDCTLDPNDVCIEGPGAWVITPKPYQGGSCNS